MTSAEFLEYLVDKCARNRITLIFSCQKEERLTGFFDHIERELSVYVNRPKREWLPDAVHEMCHLDQFLEDLPLFWKAGEYGLIMGDEKHWERYDQTTLKSALDVYRELEYDCEARAVKFIQENSLPIDIDTYCQNANACLYYYGLIQRTGWQAPPANYPDLVSAMPTELKRCKNIPQWVRKEFSKYYG